MQIWTGKFCLFLAFVVAATGCSSKNTKPAARDEIPAEVSLKNDRQDLEKLRKDIPEEKRQINDRLAEMLNRWKAQKMEPERLREHFDDEIRKLRAQKERDWKNQREDFERHEEDSRQAFQDKQKKERDDFLSDKHTSDQRSRFFDRQNKERDRFYADERDARDELNATLRDERRDFEQFVSDRHAEFHDEFPEYTRIYDEMKKAEEEKREAEKENPKPYTRWPYKFPGDTSNGNGADEKGSGAALQNAGVPAGANKGAAADVNRGGNGWPASDPSEFNEMPNAQKPGP